ILKRGGKELSEGELKALAKELAESAEAQSLKRALPNGHVFDSHAHEWFGLACREGWRPTARQIKEWLDLIEHVGRSKNAFKWSLHGRITNAHLAKVNGKWFVVQYYEDSGVLASAFMPKGDQLANMLEAAGLQ